MNTVFADNFGSWHPLSEIHLDLEKISDSVNRLEVTGDSKESYTYFYGNPMDLKPGVRYRLSARLRVDKIDPAIGPTFSFLYIGKVDGKWVWTFIGNAETNQYDLKTGGDQTLKVEFTLPEPARGGRIHFAKHTNQPISIDASIEKIEIVEV